jgi:hypothetical protein
MTKYQLFYWQSQILVVKTTKGWKDIAAYLDVAPRTAQDYERNLGLPVHRLTAADGRAIAQDTMTVHIVNGVRR